MFRVPKDEICVWNDTWKCYEVHSKSSRAQWKDCEAKSTYCQVRLLLKKMENRITKVVDADYPIDVPFGSCQTVSISIDSVKILRVLFYPLA